MRISFVLSTLRLSGGERVVVEYANRLSRRGHRVCLVVSSGAVEAEIAGTVDTTVRIIESPARFPREPRKAGPIRLASLTIALARAVPVSDVVISTHTPTTVAVWLATHWMGKGLPIWFYQDYTEMFDGRPVEAWLMRNALRWHRRALVVSEATRQELNSTCTGDIRVVGEGINHPRQSIQLAQYERRLDPFHRGRVVFFLGDMRPRKGMADFLTACERVSRRWPDLQLWIASKEDCQIESRLPFEFFRRPSDDEYAALLQKCDLFVSASWSEGFGLPPLEAMSYGAPVVLTDSRGVREYARPGENCLMTPPHDPAALAEAILTVLQDDELAERLRGNGPPTAARFSWEAATDRFESALRDL
jgi:glycosyltransferase involved in cell wall biosynthesis